MTEEVQNHPIPNKPSNFEDVTYSLEITRLKTVPSNGNDIVIEVSYSLKGEYMGIRHCHESVVCFDANTVVIDGNFIPFSNLTKEIVSQWVTSNYPEIHLKYSLAEILLKAYRDITEKNNPNLPWSN